MDEHAGLHGTQRTFWETARREHRRSLITLHAPSQARQLGHGAQVRLGDNEQQLIVTAHCQNAHDRACDTESRSPEPGTRQRPKLRRSISPALSHLLGLAAAGKTPSLVFTPSLSIHSSSQLPPCLMHQEQPHHLHVAGLRGMVKGTLSKQDLGFRIHLAQGEGMIPVPGAEYHNTQ